MSKRTLVQVTAFGILAVTSIVVGLVDQFGSEHLKDWLDHHEAWIGVLALLLVVIASVAQDLALYYRSPKQR